MNRKASFTYFIILSITLFLAASIPLSLTSCTKRDEDNKYVIGIMNPNPRLNMVVDGFKKGMAGYGYVENKNITYIIVNRAEDFDSSLKDFKNSNVNLVMTLTTPATKKAKIAMKGTDIPVVFGTSFDPVKSGIVKSLTHQADNITGIKVGGNTQKALDLLLAVSPGTKRVLVPVKFDTKAASLSLAELEEAAEKLRVDLLVSRVESLNDLQGALTSLPEDVDAVFIINSIFIVSNIKHIIEASIKLKIPVGAATHMAPHGGVISYSQRGERSGEQAGRLAHKILQGTPASRLPVETADFFLGINLKTAKAIGLEIPYDILDQADYVIR